MAVFSISFFAWFLLGIILALYLFLTRKYGYWKSLGIPEVPPSFFMGSIGLDLKTNQGLQEQKWYKKYGRIFGIYEGSTPVLMIAEPELLKDILLKDFYVFSNQRKLKFGDPILDKRLYVQNGKKWRNLRNIMRPAFTSCKLKSISKLIEECTETLVDNLIEEAKRRKEVDINQSLSAFTIDVIARCAFGLKIDSKKDPNNRFVKAANELIEPIPWRNVVRNCFPEIATFFQLSYFEPSLILYFKSVIIEEINKRNKLINEEKPCDFLQLLIETKENLDENYGQRLELDDIVAQCINFFIAGYFATSATLAFTIHQLAVKPHIQERIIKEEEFILKNEGDLNYDTLNEMRYLEAVIHETLRYYSPAIRLERTTTEEYRLGSTGVTLPKRTIVAVPVYAISHDPKYFQFPDKYNPERFFGENRKSIQPFTYMPFGAGPRNCIGMKFAFMEIKLALAKILYYVKFRPGSRTKHEVDFLPGRGFNRPREVILKVEIQKEKCRNL
ncbi:cytochrome P450 3A11-like [Centruroides vittatus]|uniref:cytochrome P450 3A11-like n=1 Tax=Centruroides vittatus TaxID=120091 RepID=UPI00350EEC58